jgi:hypothetical protein
MARAAAASAGLHPLVLKVGVKAGHGPQEGCRGRLCPAQSGKQACRTSDIQVFRADSDGRASRRPEPEYLNT